MCNSDCDCDCVCDFHGLGPETNIKLRDLDGGMTSTKYNDFRKTLQVC